MPVKKGVATQQRRNIILEAVKRLSRTGIWVTKRDLVNDLTSQGYTVVKRHVQSDLRALLDSHPELKSNDNSRDGLQQLGMTDGYRWLELDAPPETGLSMQEALSLVLVSKHLKQALPSTLTRSLDSLFDRAERTLDFQKANAKVCWRDIAHVVSPIQQLIPPTIASDVLNAVHGALLAEEQLNVVYQNADNRKEKLSLHPLGILMREPVSYLVALYKNYDDPRLYAIHRFQSAKRTYQASRKPDGFSMNAYAKELERSGIGQRITLKARVRSYLAIILSEAPLDATQVLQPPDKEGWSLVTSEVKDTWRLRWWILSRSNGIVIDEPIFLRDAIAEQTQSMAKLYSDQ